MRVALCTRNPANPVIRLLARALEENGSRADVIDDPRQVLGAARWDAGFWRPDARSAEIAAYSRQAAVILEGLGTPFLNSLASMDRAASKLVSFALFTAAGLPVVSSWAAPRPGHTLDEDVSGPLIVKPLWGKQARGVSLCPTVEEALTAAERLGAPALLQRPVPWRHQFRCVATPDDVIRVYRAENPRPDEPTISRFDRSTAVPFEPVPPEVAGLATAMVATVGGDLMRADVLEGQDGRLQGLEVNASFGFRHDDSTVVEAILRGFARVASGP